MSLRFAPPPKVVDGLYAVPIDIQSVTAQVTFDASSRTASASATMTFKIGDFTGRPIFDLRQTITSAMLDGSPVATSKLGHHSFNGAWSSRLRVIDRQLSAGSLHTLELSYSLGQPLSDGSQPLGWQNSPAGLTWDFWFSDLWPARYLEMWFPSNLVYDEFPFSLEMQLVNAATNHTLIMNGQLTNLGTHHWKIDWPTDTSSFAPMLYLTPTSKLDSHTTTFTAPGVGNLTLELYKLKTVSTSLSAAASLLQTKILDFIEDVGPYLHGNRFRALLWTGGRSMEYNGGTTSNASALVHETFHSWFARCVKPATQNDSWLDEGWTTYNTGSPPLTSSPFDPSDPPVQLRSPDPYNRITPGASYGKGKDFFAGLAAEFGVGQLRSIMREFYAEYAGRGVTTEQLAAFIIQETGRVDLADWFHQFVYGYSIPSSGPDLFLKDAPPDMGAVPYSGQFWRSPDVWVRNFEDGSTTHQDPEFGQDNWFYARVRNRSSVPAQTCVVTFTVKSFAGSQFVYPQDWAPFIAVAFAIDLPGYSTKIVGARWPKPLVPPPGTHGCLLAQVYTPDDPGSVGAHVWEDNNLAQRNLQIVDLLPDESADVSIRFGSSFSIVAQRYRIEVVRPRRWSHLPIALVHRNPQRLAELLGSVEPQVVRPARPRITPERVIRFMDRTRVEVSDPNHAPVALNMKAGSTITARRDEPLTPPVSAVAAHRLRSVGGRGGAAVQFGLGVRSAIPVRLAPGRPIDATVRVAAPSGARPGDEIDLDVVQRNEQGVVIGGVGIQLRIVARKPRK